MSRRTIYKHRRGASAAARAAFQASKAAGTAGSGIAGGAQAYYNANPAAASAARSSSSGSSGGSSGGGGGGGGGGAVSISKKNSIGKNLKAAYGANKVLSNKELLKISRTNKKSAEKVLERAVKQGMLIGSGVVNKYQRGKYTDPRMSMARQALPGFAMAAGKDSAILQQLRNAGRLDKGSALFIGSKGSTATTLPRRSGLGDGYRPPGGDIPNTQPPGGDGGMEDLTFSDGFEMPPLKPEEEEEPDLGQGMMSGGGMGAAGANKLGRAKSRIRKLGIYGRGTGLLGRGLQYGNSLNA